MSARREHLGRVEKNSRSAHSAVSNAFPFGLSHITDDIVVLLAVYLNFPSIFTFHFLCLEHIQYVFSFCNFSIFFFSIPFQPTEY
jgi:hypothetical protein